MKHKLIFVTLTLLIFLLPIFSSSQHKRTVIIPGNIKTEYCFTKKTKINLIQKTKFFIEKNIINISYQSDYNYYNGNIYYMCKKLEGNPDIYTFNTLPTIGGYAFDKNYVYINNKIITGAIPPANHLFTFVSSDIIYTKNNQVFIGDRQIEGTDIQTLKALTWGFSRDKNHVYLDNKILSGADPESFVVVDLWNSYDKNHKYEGYRIVE